MKLILITAIGLALPSCKPSYSFEGQQQGGDPYRIEWIADDGRVATCIVVQSSSSSTTTTAGGIEVNSTTFTPEGSTLVISDAAGEVKERLRIQDYIFFCSSGGYKKIERSPDISDLISTDYRYMDHKLIDHLVSTKVIP
jgi:hypothetical protein